MADEGTPPDEGGRYSQERHSDRVPIIEDAETGNRFLVYSTERGSHVELLYEGDTFWASQDQMAEMFGVSQQAVSQHIRNIFGDGELSDTEATHKKILLVRKEGTRAVRREIDHYDLNTVISVGYRVTSKQGTLFRIWATDKLFQILTKGFYIDQRKLKGQPDRLAELRRIIQDIRADEANLYAELRRILSMCQDYALNPEGSRLFFASFQNRLLYAITGHTAAEILLSRADAAQPEMGLRSWTGDEPLQDDALTAKNYLGALELRDLNRLVDMVLTFFEDQTERGWLVTLADAETKLGEILAVNKRNMLPDGPRATKVSGERHAKQQYKLFDAQRRDERKQAALAQLNEQAKAIKGATRGRRKKASK